MIEQASGERTCRQRRPAQIQPARAASICGFVAKLLQVGSETERDLLGWLLRAPALFYSGAEIGCSAAFAA
jgi:hypothetical protein